MKFRLLFVLFACGLAWFGLSSRSGGLGAVSNQDRTGSPVSVGTCASCHSGGSFGTQATITVRDAGNNIVSSYIPGDNYTIEIVMSSALGSPAGYGTQLSVLNASNTQAGTFGSTITSNTQISTVSGRQLLEHFGISSSGIFQANWTAPVAGTGTVTLYGNGIAVNGTGSTAGDQGSAPVSLGLSEAVVTSISYSSASYCQNDIDPTPTQTGTSGGSYGSTTGLSINGTSGLIDLSASAPGTYTVTYNYSGGSTTTQVTITAQDQASISYPTAIYCASGTGSISPTLTGTTGGSYSSTTGLAINSGTGIIDLANSQAGTYVVSYVTNNACPTTATSNITISPSTSAAFGYGGSSFCISGANPSPTITGDAGGVFSGSNNGIDVNSSTGTIDLSISNPGNYTVTYIVGSTCPDTQSVSVNISAAGDASFDYNGQTSFCSDDGNPLPDITGNPGGTFSSSNTNLSVNSSTGEIDLSTAQAGSYVVSYVVSGTCSDSQAVSITVNITDDASFSYADSSYCLNGDNPVPTVTGASGGSFASTTGLVIDSNSGEIDLSSSVAGDYVVEYVTTGVCPNQENFDISIEACSGLETSQYAASTVYPNPSTHGVFTLNLGYLNDDDHYAIFNAQGQLLESAAIQQLQTRISLEHYPKGAYWLKLQRKDGTIESFRLIYR